MVSEKETDKVKTITIIYISRLCVLHSLLVTWRSNAGMVGCSFVQAPSTYCISSAGDSAGVIWERTFMSHCLTVPSSGYEKSIHRTTMEDVTKCKSDWVTGYHPWLWSGSYAPWQPGALSGLSILDARVDDSCSGSGLSALDLVHSSTTSLHQVINVLWRNTIHISP